MTNAISYVTTQHREYCSLEDINSLELQNTKLRKQGSIGLTFVAGKTKQSRECSIGTINVLRLQYSDTIVMEKLILELL